MPPRKKVVSKKAVAKTVDDMPNVTVTRPIINGKKNGLADDFFFTYLFSTNIGCIYLHNVLALYKVCRVHKFIMSPF